MTVGPGGVFPSEPPAEPESCETVTAMLTIETTSYGTTTTDGTVTTTATRVLSSEFPMLGCALTDTSTATTVTACDARSTPTAVLGRRADPIITRGGCEDENTMRDVFCTLHHPEDPNPDVWLNQLNVDENAQEDHFEEFMPVSIRQPSNFVAFVFFTQVRLGYLEDRLNGQHNAVCLLCFHHLLPLIPATKHL